MSYSRKNEGRPDPDALLHTIESDLPTGRGRLKIFFGAAPGVGKTFSMLEAARRDRSAGRDVIIGYVEPHQRPETSALLEGLEQLGRRQIPHGGVTLSEFDVQAALERRPELIVVDELAHTNAPGSLNEKRWQDIELLLDAGLDVYTTLNVQHLESMNDLVAQVTGVFVRETVPDRAFDSAWEVELVDLPPDDLIGRLRSGKVYLPEQAERAQEAFFRKGNLVALRELALRRTAERVDRQLQDFRRAQALPSVWPLRDRLLVCVGPSPLSGKLVRATRRMAASLRCPWIAVHIDVIGRPGISSTGRERTSRNLRLAERLGAETVVLPAADMVSELIKFARERNITKIIVGKPSQPRWRELLYGSFVSSLTKHCGEMDVYVISGDPGEGRTAGMTPSASPRHAQGYLASLAVVGACTAVSWIVWRRVDPINLVMVYLLGVVAVASRLERGPATLAAFLSVALFDLLFIPPFWTFAVSDTQYLFTFGAMLVTGLTISNLTLRLRAQGMVLRAREQRTASLFSFSKQLFTARTVPEAQELACRLIGEASGTKAAIIGSQTPGRLDDAPALGSQFPIDEALRAVAVWSFEHNQIAGEGTETLSAARARFYPITVQGQPVGVLGLQSGEQGEMWESDRGQLIETFLELLASVLERAHLSKQAEDAKLDAAAERLRNTLLNSVSHDLRTPLAIIEGASTTLVEGNSNLEPSTRRSLLETIVTEAEYLNRLVGNILDASRLEAGGVRLRKEWQSIEEILGAVNHRLSRLLTGREIIVRLPDELPLVFADGLMLHQVFMNLVENAAKFSPVGATIEIEGRSEGGGISIAVLDRGSGILEADLPHLFDKFYRGTPPSGRAGAGLGLTVTKEIVALHGGTITAANRPGGGSIFRVWLPIGKEQPPVRQEMAEG